MKYDFDVVILGGGPVGLSMSIQLSRLGVSHLLLERYNDVSRHPKSRLLNPRSLELLRSWGLESEIHDVRVTVKPTFYFGKDLVSEWRHVFRTTDVLSAEARSVSPCEVEGVLCSQDVLEPVLRKAALSYDKADVRFGWEGEVIDGLGSDGPVTVRAHNLTDGTNEVVKARFLIAADGAMSATRDTLGVGAKMADRSLDAISVLFQSDLSAYGDSKASFFVLDNPETIGTAVIAPVDENGRAALLGRPKVMNEQPLDSIDWAEILRFGAGVPDLPLEIIDVRSWRATVSIANEYQRGNTFFVGDAAHLMPPNGGFNMNTGMQDAHNLAWKMAAVLQGWADERLLRSYEAERRPIALFNAAEAVRNLEALVDKDEKGQAGGFRKDHYVHPGLALGYRYNNGAVAHLTGQNLEDDWAVGEYKQVAIPGVRAPHLWLTGEGGRKVSTLDLFEQALTLLTTPSAMSVWKPVVEAAVAETDVPLNLISVGNGGEWNSVSGVFESLYNLEGNEAVLVRPDGHIGWRGGVPEGRELVEALACLTGQTP